MGTILFSAASFRAQFPNAFPDPPNTDAILQLYWDAAICFISPVERTALSGDCLRQLLNLATAHMIEVASVSDDGGQAGFVESATIDKVQVAIQSFPNKTYLQAFFSTTPYGIQAYAQLEMAGAGGSYLGATSLGELNSFRRAGGLFLPSSPNTGAPTTTTECILLTSPPPAPFDFDFGTLDADSFQQSIVIPAGCVGMTIEFAGVDPSAAVDIAAWSGNGVDSGNRFNFFYWDSDDRANGNPPTVSATNQNVTGMTSAAGFVMATSATGSAANNPNLLVISGFDIDDSQVLNVEIAVA